ncbi:hypothetical protein Forpi1262_v016691 [Fusarium oxysporum f. sp. raphani]|uniref:Uncharacterized protein n=1 Tax=Fusarium oxysporum f. sp. raphani TaxID=96318 RepID=A0A8J5P0V1_FUSOX|nr:hypothetical protein Forpi1262_v016691 [Fusarium oxysporum f. sp. raphani]
MQHHPLNVPGAKFIASELIDVRQPSQLKQYPNGGDSFIREEMAFILKLGMIPSIPLISPLISHPLKILDWQTLHSPPWASPRSPMGRGEMPITNDEDLVGNIDQEAQVTNSHPLRGKWVQNDDAHLEPR